MLARRRFTTLLSVASLAAPSLAHAREEYPSRAIRLIVPWPPGGGVDAFARVVQAALAEQLGQAVVIDNIGGGSGRIGTQTAARAALRPAFDPVTLAISGPQGLYTHPKSGIRTVAEFAAAAKARPGRLNVGVPGLGSSQHLTSELLLRAAGNLRVTHVPYRGGGPLLQDLVSGNIDGAVVTFAAGAQQAKSGHLVPLAVTSAARTPTFSDVPTASESIAPGFVQATWMGIFAPRGTPFEIRHRVNDALGAVLENAAIVSRLRDLGFVT